MTNAAIKVGSSIKVRERNVRRVWRWVVRFQGAIVGTAPALVLAYCRHGWTCSRERLDASAAAALHEVPL